MSRLPPALTPGQIPNRGEFEFRKWKINKERRYDTTWDKERPKTVSPEEKSPSSPIVTNLHHDNHEVLPKDETDDDDGDDTGGSR